MSKPYKFHIQLKGQRVRYFEYLYYVYNVYLCEKDHPLLRSDANADGCKKGSTSILLMS